MTSSRWFRRALWSALALVLALGVGELLARRSIAGSLDLLDASDDPVLLNRLKPGHYESDGYFLKSAPVTYDVDAKRCRTVPGAAAPSGQVVQFLGSSVVFGIALDADQTLPEIARRELAAGSPALAIDARNCSVPGYTLVQTLRHAELMLEREGVTSLAIIVSPTHGAAPFDWHSIVPRSEWLRWLTTQSRLARLIYLAHLMRETNGFRLPPANPEVLRAGLTRVATLARERGALVTFFTVGEFEHPAFKLVDELSLVGLTVVALERPPREPRYVHSDGDHWTPEGIHFLVKQMTPALTRLGEAR